MIKNHLPFALLIFLAACSNGPGDFDASGTFESEEVIVSSETAGRILRMDAAEGTLLEAGQVSVLIDTTALSLQSEQVEASIDALGDKTADLQPYIRTLEQQLRVQRTQLEAQERERNRIANLVRSDAATAKQLDDAETVVKVTREQIALTERQLEQQKSTIGTQNRGILSEKTPLEKRKDILDDQLNRARVSNPVKGTVLAIYARAGETTAPGKALYKIADLSEMTLRAYISGDQLSRARIGNTVKVYVDGKGGEYVEFPGKLTWVSDKAEFTPKTIMTKDERANLVYAVKITVKNDGSLKIGMYGDVKF